MYHSAQSRWFITSVLEVSSASVGHFLYVGGFVQIFSYLLAWRSSVLLSHACMFDVAHDFLVQGRMCGGTYSSIVPAVLCNSIFPRHVVVLVFNAGMCCRTYGFARAEMFSFVTQRETGPF